VPGRPAAAKSWSRGEPLAQDWHKVRKP
jgi:hypothetical protein